MIKAYTDINQSKMLAKILPLDSADMYLSRCAITDFGDGKLKVSYAVEPCNVSQTKNTKEDIPCWSLAALLGIIPVTIERADNRCRLRIDKSEKDFDIWYEEVDSGLVQSDLDIITPNMVDTCVEMIEKLHNKKLTLWQK